MNEFIILLIIACNWCFGIFTPFHEGYILESIGDRIRSVIGKQLSKPIFGCPPCMASIHGAAIGLFWWGIDLRVIPFMICLCGLNFIIKNIIFPEYE
jgi:hypothetical protein